MRARILSLCLLALSLGCVTPSASYWVPDSRHVETLDYAPWDDLLRAHVTDGYVDYPAFGASAEFSEFRRALRKVRFTRETTMQTRTALWLNGYNVAAIFGILGGGSPATLFGRHLFFQRTQFALGGEEITLWDLEHERLRRLADPRIHFAIVCASASCPRLASESFDPARLDEQLDKATRAFINDSTRNAFDLDAGVARISQIFEWYAEDFQATDGSVPEYIARYLDDSAAAAALREGTLEIEYLPYDWSLNGRPVRSD